MRTRTRIAIAAGSERTAAAGARMAELGGNPVDIAVGAAMTALVAEILACSPGGAAFVMLRVPDRVTELIEGADAVPGQGPRRPRAEPSRRAVRVPSEGGVDGDTEVQAGSASIAVPGALAALELAWRRHGSLPWRELVAPARELARDGIPVAPATARRLAAAGHALFGAQEDSRRSFFPGGSEPPAPGTLLRIPDLGDALDYIAHEGARAFYQGDIAVLFAREMEASGGLVTREDLAAYQAVARPPLTLASRGFTLALAPPPAVGGAVAGASIGLLQLGWDPAQDQAARARLHARAQARVLEAGAGLLAGALDDSAARALLAPESLAAQAALLHASSTTHLSVASEDGWVIAITASMGHGAGVTIPGTGIPCNNGLGLVEQRPDGSLAARPGTRLISNACPTVAWSDRRGCALALGSPGGSRMASAVAQVWARYALEGVEPEAAVAAPRLHVERHDQGLRVHCEPGIDTRLLAGELRVRAWDRPDAFFGSVQLAARDRQGRLQAVADPRGGGATRVASAGA